MKPISVLIFPLFVPVAAHAATVVSPYYQNFDSYAADGPTDFQEDNSAAFVIIEQSPSTDKAFRARIASSTNASASVQVSGGAGNDFSVSTDLTFAGITTGTSATSINFSLAGAGTSAAFGANEYRIVMDFLTGEFDLVRNGTTVSLTSETGTVPTVNVGSVYTMSLSGAYSSPTDVLLSLSISDGTNTFSGTYADGAALSGSHFGYRIAKNGSGTVLNVELDEFNLSAVPEPSAPMMLSGALASMLFRRNRKR